MLAERKTNERRAPVDREAGDALTPLKLQKLLYYAQGWTLGFLDKPLFDEEIRAWVRGPAVPEVYLSFKKHGFEAIPKPETAPELDKETEDVLLEVFDIYGGLSAIKLEKLTHQATPWKNAREGYAPEEKCNVIIPKNEIKKHYKRIFFNSGYRWFGSSRP